jgi:predicted nuclease with RNAse H fold
VTLVCGVDVGSLKTPAYVAWLEEDAFELGTYQPTREQPLPLGRRPAVFALDALQSLPLEGRSRRAADRDAKTPTSVLPTARADVALMRAYGPFVDAGITIFWEAQRNGLAVIPGLTGSGPALLETYPRFVIRRLWPDLRPSRPSERHPARTSPSCGRGCKLSDCAVPSPSATTRSTPSCARLQAGAGRRLRRSRSASRPERRPTCSVKASSWLRETRRLAAPNDVSC